MEPERRVRGLGHERVRDVAEAVLGEHLDYVPPADDSAGRVVAVEVDDVGDEATEHRSLDGWGHHEWCGAVQCEGERLAYMQVWAGMGGG